MSDPKDPSMEEIEAIAELVMKIGGGLEPHEALMAQRSGWNPKEFKTLYEDYIRSTQVTIKPGDDTTALKGIPLERVANYLLVRGGFASELKDGGLQQQWQVDGVGPVRTMGLQLVAGTNALRFGTKVYMEAKNHIEPMGGTDFGHHCSRMSDHECHCGVVVSTSGFAVTDGQGFANKIFHNFLRDTLHLLLSVRDLRRVALGEAFPLTVLREAYVRTSDEQYQRSDVQSPYAKSRCLQDAKDEYDRIKAAA
jgi:hypothetical protein